MKLQNEIIKMILQTAKTAALAVMLIDNIEFSTTSLIIN
jgi:hypothetical protein